MAVYTDITDDELAELLADFDLGAALSFKGIAEGVENLRQMEVLHRLGCGVMQGFLFSKPQLPEDIETWLQQTVLPRQTGSGLQKIRSLPDSRS